MAKYYVPIYVQVEAQTPAHAASIKGAVERLIVNQNGFVAMALTGAGVTPERIVVGEPAPVQYDAYGRPI